MTRPRLLSIRSERRLCEEVHLNLAYRWFCRLGLGGDVPDHSTFSKNRHGRFREVRRGRMKRWLRRDPETVRKQERISQVLPGDDCDFPQGSNRSLRTEVSGAGKRNFQGGDKATETAVKIQMRPLQRQNLAKQPRPFGDNRRACLVGLRAALPVCSTLLLTRLPLALLTPKRDLRFNVLWVGDPI
jgi:hypothetical protein